MMICSSPRHPFPKADAQACRSPQRQVEIRALFDRLAPGAPRMDRAQSATSMTPTAPTCGFLVPPRRPHAGNRLRQRPSLGGSLAPAYGVGLDLSPEMIRLANADYPAFQWRVGNAEDPAVLAALDGPFDFVILSDSIGLIEDCEALFKLLQRCMNTETRLIIAYYSHIWEPFLRLAEMLGQKMLQLRLNYLSTADIANLLMLADYDVVGGDWRQLLPKVRLRPRAPDQSADRALPLFIRRLCLQELCRCPARKTKACAHARPHAIGDRGHSLPQRARQHRRRHRPSAGDRAGHGSDLRRGPQPRRHLRGMPAGVRDANPGRDIKVLRQDGRGKGDAVRKGFDAARGDTSA